MRMLITSLALAAVLTACSSDEGPKAAEPTAPTTSGVTDPPADAPAPSDVPSEVAAEIKAGVPTVVAIVELTEDNDVNNLIGRPGKYDAATFLADKRLGCTADTGWGELGVECGAKLERWPSEEDARARAADIQRKLKEFGLGAEYDYVRGSLLLRVAGDLKPSEAKQYEAAFAGGVPAA